MKIDDLRQPEQDPRQPPVVKCQECGRLVGVIKCSECMRVDEELKPHAKPNESSWDV